MSDPIHGRSTSESIVKCVSLQESVSANTNDIEEYPLNNPLANIGPRDTLKENKTYPHNFDKSTNEISDNCDLSLQLRNNSTVKLKDRVVVDLANKIDKNVTNAESTYVFVNESEPCKESITLTETINSKEDKNYAQAEELCSNSVSDKFCAVAGIVLNQKTLNGDVDENTTAYSLLNKSFNNEVNPSQCGEGGCRIVKNNLNGLKADIYSTNFKVPISSTGIVKDKKFTEAHLKPVIQDSSKVSILNKSSKYVKSIYEPSKSGQGYHNYNINLSDSEVSGKETMKITSSEPHLTASGNCDGELTKSTLSRDSDENDSKLESVWPQSLELKGNNSCRLQSKKLDNSIEFNNLDEQIDYNSCVNDNGAINRSCNGSNHPNYKEVKVGSNELKVAHEQLNKMETPEGSSKSCQSTLMESLITASNVPSARNALSHQVNSNETELSHLKDNYQGNEDISSCGGSSEDVGIFTKRSNYQDNFCIICKKEVDQLYFHAAKFHSCFAFVPVKYMKNYQEHLVERSPNINECYLYSLSGDELYMCRICGILLKSIASVRVHLTIHSEIYAVFCSSNKCSCCKLNVIYSICYISSLLHQSSNECFLCHQLTSCKLSLYNHLKVVHFNKNCCQKCSKDVSEKFSEVLDHNLVHSDDYKLNEIGDVAKDCFQFSWNVLNNSLNSLDGKEDQLRLKNNSSDRSFVFPIKITSVEEQSNIYIHPSTLIKKYVASKFMWKRSLDCISKYASLSFDVYIQIMLSKKLMAVKKKKSSCKKAQNFLASFGLKPLCRSSKRKSCIADNPNDVKLGSKHKTEIKNEPLDGTTNTDVINNDAFEVTDNLVEISGEWTNTHVFLCCSCGTSFDCLTDVMDHKWLEHPGVWCAHTMLKGKEEVPFMFSQQYQPNTNFPIVKGTLKEFHSNPRNVKCTKCKQTFLFSEFCSHAVECGDLNQIIIKKKCRKTARLQSHKGQRMSSRYASPLRKSYKNSEEETKCSSSDAALSRWNNSNTIKSSKAMKNEASVLGNSQGCHNSKRTLRASKKNKKCKPKKKKFCMKLRHVISKNSKTSNLNSVPNLKKNNTHKGFTKSLLHRKKLVKKVSLSESLKIKKNSKIIRKKPLTLKRNKKNYNLTKKNVVNSKPTNLLNENNKDKVKTGIKKRKQNFSSFQDKRICPDSEDDSDSEIKNTIFTEKRREGLRARQEKNKINRYSLRKQPENPENVSTKETVNTSSTNESTNSIISKEAIKQNYVKESELTNSIKKPLKSSIVKDDLLKCHEGKEPLNISNLTVSLTSISPKEPLNINSAKDLLKRAKKPLKVRRARKLLKVNRDNKPISISNAEVLVNTNSLTESQISCSAKKSVLNRRTKKSKKVSYAKESIKCSNITSIRSNNNELPKLIPNSTDSKTEFLKVTSTTEQVKSSIRRRTVKRANPPRNLEGNLHENVIKGKSFDERGESEERIGFPNKKRKYNIEDDKNNANIIGNISKKIKTSRGKCSESTKITSFGKFLKSFKEKSKNLNSLAHSKKFSDFKMIYKLTKRKIRTAVPNLDKEKMSLPNQPPKSVKLKKSQLNKSNKKRQLRMSIGPVSDKKKTKNVKLIDGLKKKRKLNITRKSTKKLDHCSQEKELESNVQAKSVLKSLPKDVNRKQKKRKMHLTNTDNCTGSCAKKDILVGKNIPLNDTLVNQNLDIPEERMELCENKYTEITPNNDAAKVGLTSSCANNCNISVKNDPGTDKKRKNSSKENRFTYRKRKLRSKESFCEPPLPVNFICHDCGLQFETASSQEDHQLDCKNIAFEMSIMADEKLFECPHCQLTFAMAGAQKKHTSSCRARKPRKYHKFNCRTVKKAPKNDEVVRLLSYEQNMESIPEEIPVDLNNIARRLKNYCLTHSTAPLVCSLLYSCSLSTAELRTCLSESISVNNSTLVQPKSDVNSVNKRNFLILKSLLDQPECADLADVLYKVMLSVKANTYVRMKDFDKPLLNAAEIPPLVIDASRPELLKALAGIEEFLKEGEQLENSVQKDEMLHNMKLAFEAGTCS